jgi:hypothetical protein
MNPKFYKTTNKYLFIYTPTVIPWGRMVKQTNKQTNKRTNKWTNKRTNIYSIFRDKLSLPHVSSDFHAKKVDVNLAGKNILKSSLNAQINHQTYHCCRCQCCCCILHCCCHCLNLSPVQAPLLVALPLLGTVVSQLCLFVLAILLSSSSNIMSWVNY